MPSLIPKVIFGQGYTALHLACDRGNLAVVEVLLKHDVDQTLKVSCSFMCCSYTCAQKCSIQDQDELTALELAETSGHDEIVRVLKDRR